MDQRISLITLGVRDLAASKKFYVEGLGWKPAFENKEIIFFQAGGLIFALFLRDELARDFNADPATLGRSAMALAYNVRTKSEVDRSSSARPPREPPSSRLLSKPRGAVTPATSLTPTASPGKLPSTHNGKSPPTAPSATAEVEASRFATP
jgi:catechol 2,3-dioxygenase-like lactoylglutathione lyase family enzyme